MKINIITIFPKIIEPYINESILKHAQEKKLVEFQIHDLRNWTDDVHKSVDAKPYGGGAGMLMKVEPIFKAVTEIKSKSKSKKIKTIVLTAKGETFKQSNAKKLVKEEEIILIAPRYEGIDHRVIEHIADEAISIGNYILTGGELPALVVSDSIVRLLPGVLGNKESLEEESFADSENSQIEYPQYTRPEEFNGWKVPKLLLSGNHKNIKDWKSSNLTTKSKNES